MRYRETWQYPRSDLLPLTSVKGSRDRRWKTFEDWHVLAHERRHHTGGRLFLDTIAGNAPAIAYHNICGSPSTR